MKHRQVHRKLAIWTLVVIFVCMASIIFGCGSVSPATRYANKTAKPVEYAYWERSQLNTWEKVFGKSDGKDWRIGVAEKQVKAYNLKKERAEKESEVLKKVEQIKSQIGNE